MDNLGVTVGCNSNSDNEYIIRDKNKIIIGRFDLIEIEEDAKKYSIRLRFYRREESELLEASLRVILQGLFKNVKLEKVNIYIHENMPIASFLNLGFNLEGVLSNNIYNQGEFFNELIMGINRCEYQDSLRNDYTSIHSENLIIRVLTPEDSEELLQYYIDNKKHLEQYEPKRDKSFYTVEVQSRILQESYRQYLSGTSLDCGIFKNNTLIGKVKISNIVYGIFKSGIIGYSMDKNYQGKGYMKEAVNRITEYAFSELGLHRLEASALVDNERSKGVLIGCGFKELGINKNYLFINGKWRDHITYYKVKS